MSHLPVHRHNRQTDQGFTKIEILFVMLITGILTAIAAPSMIATQDNAKLNSALDVLQNALETSQFQAIKTNKICTVSIPNHRSSIEGNCLINGSSIDLTKDTTGMMTIDHDIIIRTEPSWKTTNSTTTPTQVIYNSQGLTQSEGTIILGLRTSATINSAQKCLKINAGIGLIRSGKYNHDSCEAIE